MAVSLNQNNDSMMGDINVTPLVDVMLVLLIIFMVAAPLIQQQVDVDLPETASKSSAAIEEKDIILVIDKKQKIFVNNIEIPYRQLTPKLKAIYDGKRKKEIYLQADQTIPYGFVVKVMALLKNAGIDKMGMITKPEKLKS